MTPPADPARYKHHRFPGEIISHGNLAKVAPSITGAKTRIVPRGNVRIACRGGSPRGMRSVFCPRMDPWPNTFAHDGMCSPRRRTAKRGGVDARVGPK